MIIIDGIRYKEADARRLGLVKTTEGDAPRPQHKSIPAPTAGAGAAAKGRPAAKTPRAADGDAPAAG